MPFLAAGRTLRRPLAWIPIGAAVLSFSGLARAEAASPTGPANAPASSEIRSGPAPGFASTDRTAPLGRALSLGIVGGLYVGLNVLAYLAWWVNSPPDQFEWVHDTWFEPTSYAGGSDKIGHFYMNHLLTRANAGILEEGGWHRRTSTVAVFGAEAPKTNTNRDVGSTSPSALKPNLPVVDRSGCIVVQVAHGWAGGPLVA